MGGRNSPRTGADGPTCSAVQPRVRRHESTDARRMGVGRPAARPLPASTAQVYLGPRDARGVKEVMEITARKGRIEDESADAVLLIHCEGERRLAHEAAAVDARLRGRLAGLITSGEFTGRLNQVSILHVAPNERLRAKRV